MANPDDRGFGFTDSYSVNDAKYSLQYLLQYSMVLVYTHYLTILYYSTSVL